MALGRTRAGWCGLGRAERSFRQQALVRDREADDLGLLDRAVCSFPGGGNNEITNAVPPDLGGALAVRPSEAGKLISTV
jgi:hypothetical protein